MGFCPSGLAPWERGACHPLSVFARLSSSCPELPAPKGCPHLGLHWCGREWACPVSRCASRSSLGPALPHQAGPAKGGQPLGAELSDECAQGSGPPPGALCPRSWSLGAEAAQPGARSRMRRLGARDPGSGTGNCPSRARSRSRKGPPVSQALPRPDRPGQAAHPARLLVAAHGGLDTEGGVLLLPSPLTPTPGTTGAPQSPWQVPGMWAWELAILGLRLGQRRGSREGGGGTVDGPMRTVTPGLTAVFFGSWGGLSVLPVVAQPGRGGCPLPSWSPAGSSLGLNPLASWAGPGLGLAQGIGQGVGGACRGPAAALPSDSGTLLLWGSLRGPGGWAG